MRMFHGAWWIRSKPTNYNLFRRDAVQNVSEFRQGKHVYVRMVCWKWDDGTFLPSREVRSRSGVDNRSCRTDRQNARGNERGTRRAIGPSELHFRDFHGRVAFCQLTSLESPFCLPFGRPCLRRANPSLGRSILPTAPGFRW